MSMQGVENTEDALISIIKSIKKEMKDDIMKKQIEASTASIGNETFSIASNEVDTDDDNTSTTALCLLPKELSPGSFLLPFNIDNHSLYAIITLDAKDNIIPLNVYEYLGLDEFKSASTVENTIGTNEPLGTIDILCIEKIYMVDTRQEEETFDRLEIGMDLFSYESPACLEYEKRTRSYGTPNLQDKIAEPISFLPDRRGLVKRWHVCKPIHVTYDDRNGEDCRMWPTLTPNLKILLSDTMKFFWNPEAKRQLSRPAQLIIMWLTRESQTPKKIEDMNMAEYLEYEKKVNHISNTKSYLPTYFGKSTPTPDPIQEFAHYFDPNQPGTKSDCDSEDMEEEHFEEKDDVDEWLNTEITKHMSMQGVENMKDALISIIKSIRQEMKDGIMKRQFETLTASDEVSSIASNELEKAYDNTPPCRLPKELSPGSFLLPFNINNHNLYATTTLDAKDNIMPQRVYEHLRRGLVKRWHVCKPIHVTYDDGSGEDYGMWPTCDPDFKFCFGYNEVFGVNEQGSLRMWICFRDHERQTVKGSYMGFADCLQIGHNNLHESDREFIFNEWILDSYDVEEEYAREIGNPYSRRFDEYNRVFNNEIEHLSNEYILRIGKKGYILDDVWEKCQQNYKKTNEAWKDKAYEEDEMW
ncbi:hypothetical protein Tco_0712511 [Tanacetum coccineum]